MALTDLTRISTSGIATGTSLSGAILHGDAHFRGTQVGVTSALFDSSDNALEFNDNVKIKLGNGGDLNLFHNASDSVISHSGAATGSLKILSGGAQSIECLKAGAVELAHNGNKKIETTQTGAIVTGILTATGFSGSLSNTSGISTFYDLRVSNNLTVEGTTSTIDTTLIGVDRVEVGANSNSIVGVAITQSGTADIVQLFDGTSQVVTIDDTGNVGIGSAIPIQKLDVAGKGRFSDDLIILNGKILTLNNDANTANVKIDCDGGARINVKSYDKSVIQAQENWGIRFFQGNETERFTIDSTGGIVVGAGGTMYIPDKIIHSGDTNTAIRFPANDQISFETGGSEQMKIAGVNITLGTNATTGHILQIKNRGNDCNNTVALGLDIQAAWMRIGDALSGGAVYGNGLGIKFHDSGVVHWSVGKIGSSFYISNTSNNGNQLFPSSRTDALVFTSTGDATFSNNVTVSNNLTVDTNTLYVSASNNRIGINTTVPSTNLDVVGNSSISGGLTVGATLGVTGTCTLGQTVSINGTNPQLQFVDSNHNPDYSIYGSNGRFSVYDATNSAERFRINSTGKITHTYDGTAYDAQYGQFEIAKDGASNADPDWSYLSFHRLTQIGWQQGILSNDFVIASTGGASRNTLGAYRLCITDDGHVLFSGLTTKNDPRNAKGITIKSSSGGGGISFQTYGGAGSKNWRIRPDDMVGWGTLEFSVSPTTNSATDWPDHIDDVVMTLQPDKNVLINNGQLLVGTTTTPASTNTKFRLHLPLNSSSANAFEISHNTNGANKAGAALGLAINNGGASTNAADLYFQTATGGSLTEKVRINHDGGLKLSNTAGGHLFEYGGSTVNTVAAIDINRFGNGYADIRLSSNYGASLRLAGASDNTDEYHITQDNQKNAYHNLEYDGFIQFVTNNNELACRMQDGKVSINKNVETLTGNGFSAPLQVNSYDQYSCIMLGGGYNRATLGIGGAYSLVLTSNAYPANASTGGIKFRCGSSGGGGPNQRARIHQNGQFELNQETYAKTYYYSSGKDGSYSTLVVQFEAHHYHSFVIDISFAGYYDKWGSARFLGYCNSGMYSANRGPFNTTANNNISLTHAHVTGNKHKVTCALDNMTHPVCEVRITISGVSSYIDTGDISFTWS